MRKKALYSLLYRIRKSNKDVRIITRERAIFFDYSNPASIDERKIKRLRSEFNFNAQSEIRNE